jgi:hypothetical protein
MSCCRRLRKIRCLPASGWSFPVIPTSSKLSTFRPQRAPQLIIGNGGDNLASVPTVTPSAGALVGNAAVADTTIVGGFGFSTMTPNADGSWTVISRDVNGAPNATCTLQPNQISCNK